MFTGIIEETGKVKNIQHKANIMRLVVECKIVLKDLKIGDSVAINGICLTVVEKSRGSFGVDVLKETAAISNLKNIKIFASFIHN